MLDFISYEKERYGTFLYFDLPLFSGRRGIGWADLEEFPD